MMYEVIKTYKDITIMCVNHHDVGVRVELTSDVNSAYRVCSQDNSIFIKAGCNCRFEVKEIDE